MLRVRRLLQTQPICQSSETNEIRFFRPGPLFGRRILSPNGAAFKDYANMREKHPNRPISDFLPAKSGTLSAVSCSLPADSGILSAVSCSLPAESGILSAKFYSLPAKSGTLSAVSCSLPAKSGILSAVSCSLPAKSGAPGEAVQAIPFRHGRFLGLSFLEIVFQMNERKPYL